MSKVKVNQHESYTTYTLIAFFLPIVGIVLGVVYLTKNKKLDKKLGEHLVAVSILFTLIHWFLYSIYVSSLYEPIIVL